MTQKEREMLEKILNTLDDDTPRLEYANWLKDHDTGDGKRAARGEFIEVQCALASPEIEGTQRTRLAGREHELLNEHRREWEGHLVHVVKGITLHRGFIHGVTIPLDDFINYDKLLFNLAPTIREACITKCFYSDRVVVLARSPHLERLTSLKLKGVDYAGVLRCSGFCGQSNCLLLR